MKRVLLQSSNSDGLNFSALVFWLDGMSKTRYKFGSFQITSTVRVILGAQCSRPT